MVQHLGTGCFHGWRYVVTMNDNGERRSVGAFEKIFTDVKVGCDGSILNYIGDKDPE